MRIKNLLFVISLILLFEGTLLLLCIPYGIYYSEPLRPFLISASILLILGIFLFSISNKKFETISGNKESVVIIIFSWLVLILAGTMPFFVSRPISSKIDVFFETISGFTTTGSSILKNVELLPKSILFWRSLTQWQGGLVTIVMVIILMPSLNIGGYKLFSLKTLSKKIPVRNFRFIVARIFIIYCVLTITQTLLLCLGGLGLFESMCYSFGTVSTGCFSPENGSIAAYSTYLQFIMVLFMFLSGVSYLVFYMLITGNHSAIRKNEEIKVYAILILIAGLLTNAILYFQTGKGFVATFKESVFQVISLASSSGYKNSEYLKLPEYILPLVYILIFIGGCTASSGGGIKISRFLILFRNLKLQFKNPTLNKEVLNVTYNQNKIDGDTNNSVLTFITVFGFVFVIGTLALLFFVNDLKKSVFLSISALATFGHNLDLSNLPNAGKIILSLLMIIGKLEIFPFLLLFVPSFYKNTAITNIIEENE